MRARIEFDVETQEEFEDLKDASNLPGEKWTLAEKMTFKFDDETTHKMIEEVEDSISDLKESFDYLEDDDYEELSSSLSGMFTCGFNHAKRKYALDEGGETDEKI